MIDVYNNVVANWWPAKQVPLLCDPEVGSLVELRVFKNKEEMAQLH
jgi:hypothetical protein